jgi:spore coat polysaccharide biosynthesis protein SpsF
MTRNSQNPLLILVQVRTGSSRLPGKVLLPLGGRPLFARMWERVTAANVNATFGVITTTDPSDDPVEALCQEMGARCYRGDVNDLLDRHYQAWKLWGGDAIVKIPSDCPLIDPKIIERVLSFYEANRERFDYVSNLHPQSYPDGNDVEVMSAQALERAWNEAKAPFQREHTTPYFWDNPELFRVGNVLWETGLDLSTTHRWTLDYAEDYELIRHVFDSLYPKSPLFGVADIVDYVASHPEVRAVNQRHLGYVWYHKHEDELKTLSSSKEAR